MQPNASYGQYLRPPTTPSQASARHSGFGLASFVISLVGGVGSLVSIVAAAITAANRPNIGDDSPEIMLLGVLVLVFGILAPLVGTILGIVGCVQKDRKRVFAILGTVFNGVVLLGMIAVVALGIAVS